MESNEKNLPLFVVMPSFIYFSKDFTANDKLIYGYVSALSNQKGYCYASNQYIAEALGLKKDTVSKSINKFIKKGHLKSEMIYKEGTKEIEKRYLYVVINATLSDIHPIPLSDTNPIPIGCTSEDNNISIINNTNQVSSSSSKSSEEDKAKANASKSDDKLNKVCRDINDYYISKQNSLNNTKANTKKFVANIKALLKNYTVEDIKEVIDYHDYRCNVKPESKKYFVPATIFRESHFDTSYQFMQTDEKFKKNKDTSTSIQAPKYWLWLDGILSSQDNEPPRFMEYFTSEEEALKHKPL